MRLLIKKKSIRLFIINFIVITSIFIIYIGNYMNADYLTYKTLYEKYYPYGLDYKNQEIGFIILNKLAIRFGLTFFQFKNVVISISFLLLIMGICRFIKEDDVSLSEILLIFFFIALPANIVQIRMFLANSLVFFGLSFLNKKKVLNIFIFSLTLLMATLIHIASFVYIIYFIICFNINIKFLRKISLTLTICIIIFGNLFSKYGNLFLRFILSIGIRRKSETIFVSNLSIKWIVLLLIWFLISFSYMYKQNTDKYIDRINTLYPFFIALSTLSSSGSRYLRMVSIIFFISLLQFIKKSGFQKKYLWGGGLIILFLIGGAYWIPGTKSFNHVTSPILYNNYLWKR